MAAMSIASASSGGKSAFDRAAILRDAHGTARMQVAAYRAAGTFGLYGLTYRKFFATALRSAWRVAKDRAEDEAYEASLSQIPADVAERARELEAEAYWSPITSRGNDRYTLLMGQARALREDAREAAIAARELREVAAEPDDQLALDLGSFVPRPCQAAIAAHLA